MTGALCLKMFKRRHRKSTKKLPSVELVSFKSPSKDSVQFAAQAQSLLRGVKPLENGCMVLPNQSAIRESEDAGGRWMLPQQPTVTGSKKGRQVLPQQPCIVENQVTGHCRVQLESEGASKPSDSAQLSFRVSNSPPVKTHSIVHHKSRGTVITSASFGAKNVECDSEQEMVDTDFEDVFTAGTHSGLTYPSTVRRKRSDTIASLRIDCTYDL